MKIHSTPDARLAELGKLIAGFKVAMLTNTGDNGELESRPMAALEMDATGALWFFTDLRSAKVEHLRVANLSFSDADNGTYVSLSGHGQIVLDRDHIKALWTPFAKPWFPEGPESPDLVLLKFVPHNAEYWDAPHSKMVRMAAMAASIVAGKPVGLGAHDRLSGLSNGARPPG
ncbi:MAG: pyridoxamine 5'-phosphate oxidase family protein [Pseudomonadota bacterium]